MDKLIQKSKLDMGLSVDLTLNLAKIKRPQNPRKESRRLPTRGLLEQWICCTLGFWLVLALSCQKVPVQAQVLAKVNGETILVGAFLQELKSPKRVSSPLGAAGGVSPEFQKLKKKVLDQMIQSRLLLQEAKSQGLAIEEKIFQQHILEIRAAFSAGEFERILKEQGLREDQWLKMERQRLLIDHLYRKEVGEKIDITPEAVQAYYDAHQPSFVLPEQVRAQHIRVATEAEAHNVLRELKKKKGQNFADIAAKHSLSPEAKKGGDVGFYSRGEMPEVFDKAFSMKIGKISEVIESDYGFHIFKLIERKSSHQQSVEEVRPQIISHLHQIQETKLFQQWMQNLFS